MSKVLLVAPYGGVPGGISRWTRHIINYYNSFGKNDVQLELVPMGRSIFFSGSTSIIKRLVNIVKDYIPIIRQFRSKLKNNECDVLHLTTSGSLSFFKDLYMLRAAKKNGLKTCLHVRFGRLPELSIAQNWEWKIFKKVLKYTDQLIVLDKRTYSTIRKLGNCAVTLLPNPLSPVIEDIVASHAGIVRESRLILFVGHHIKTKGIYELVTACNNIGNVKLRMIGSISQETKQDLLNLATNIESIEIIGELPYEEIITNMLSCDVFVLPTYTEGFPNVILESMATSCAIVTTNVGAIPEILESDNGQDFGIMVEPRDINSLQKAIEQMLSDEEFKANCRANVARRVIERYSLHTIWLKMLDIWG